LCKRIQASEVFEDLDDLNTLCGWAAEFQIDNMKGIVDGLNDILKAIAGTNIRKDDAKGFVALLRHIALITGTQITMDRYPVSVSVAQDAKYRNARFSVREIGTTQENRRSKTVSKLPTFRLIPGKFHNS
jgi:hypothetical protein